MGKRTSRVKAPTSAPQRGGPSRTLLLALAGGGAVVVAAVLIVVSLAGGGDEGAQPPLVTTGEAQALLGDPGLFDGIPQNGLVLGSPAATVTMIEYADVQCPYCGEFAGGGLPALLDEYVRPGKVKLEFRGLRFLGPDSEKALRVVLSAARQDKAWTVLELLFANQGEENKGWVTDALVRQIGEAVVGLDVEQMLAETDEPEVDALIEKAETQGQTDGVRGTPTFFVVREGVPPHQLELGSLDVGAFRPALDAALTP